nr:hypothetical protein [Tanacetum cinerariifolium]
VKDNKENDKIKTKPDKIKSKREAWKSPNSSPTKSEPSQSQESIKNISFTDCTTKVDSEPVNGSNDDITNPYECDQTLNVSASNLNLSAGLALHRQMASVDNTSGLAPQRKERCTLQCALSLKEKKSSYLRAVLSSNSISSHARSVNKWINVQ